MYLTEDIQNKWAPVIEHADLPKIENAHKRGVTAMLLENTERALRESGSRGSQSLLSEATHANQTGSEIDNFDPVLISLVRRAMPNLIAYDICGVQPMTGPTGLIFAMRAKYGQDNTASGVEAFFNEANTQFSGIGSDTNRFGFANNTTGDTITNPVGNGCMGSSGIFTINPIDSLESPVVGSVDSEEAVRLTFNTLGDPNWWMNQSKLIGGRRADLAAPLTFPLKSKALQQWIATPGFDVSAWAAYKQ